MAQSNDSIIIIPDSISVASLDFRLDTTLLESRAEVRTETFDSIELASTIVPPEDNWHTGLEGSSRQGSLYGNSGILTIIVVLFVIVSMTFKECRKLFSRFADDLRNNKHRENAFDDHGSNEPRLTVLTIVQFLVYGGILLSTIAVVLSGNTDNHPDNFAHLVKSIGLFSCYYIFELCAYSVVGYTFAGKEGRRLWIRSLNASQSMAGVGLMIPALLALFYPQSIAVVGTLGCIIYLSARLIFIYKGFSIFYKNIFSLVYFILYLCTLEIIPLIYVIKLALLI